MTPRASRTRIEAGPPIRVYVTTPPVEGQANQAVVEALAVWLGVSKSSVRIVRGETSRDKTIQVEGIEPDAFQGRLKL